MHWTDQRRNSTASHSTILVLSNDAVAAALLGALIETFGYAVHFARPSEHIDDALRRVRPRICLVDCSDAAARNSEVLGHAAMRRISVIVFGTSRALDGVRALTCEREIDTLAVPPNLRELEATLERADARGD
jgi:DNA-binding NtrC family response regulator